MAIDVLDEGFVMRLPPEARSLAVGPRCAVLPDGTAVCSFMHNSKLTANDFIPALCRSSDDGVTWKEEGPVWPDLAERWSIFVSIGRDLAGQLFLFGSRTPIDSPGETFWSEATQGLKQNELIWARSHDGGLTWSEPRPMPMPIPGSAEAPGALCVTRRGRWLAPYSPYNTFDPRLNVDRGQVLAVFSDDLGKTWRHSSMLRFAEPDSGGAEAWLVELADGRLVGAAWHLHYAAGGDYPNAFALSHDGGETWSATHSTGVMGQSTALAPLPDGRLLFVYNQRRHGEPGVWLAVARPDEGDFGIEEQALVWRAEAPTQHGTSGEHAEWGDFSFGEPSVALLSRDTLLVTLWCIQPLGRGIQYVRVRL